MFPKIIVGTITNSHVTVFYGTWFKFQQYLASNGVVYSEIGLPTTDEVNRGEHREIADEAV